jgi:hypothetical protein
MAVADAVDEQCMQAHAYCSLAGSVYKSCTDTHSQHAVHVLLAFRCNQVFCLADGLESALWWHADLCCAVFVCHLDLAAAACA